MRELGLYIHIPFCAKKCGYCDFVSAPAGSRTQEEYVRALINEIRLSSAGCAKGRTVTSIYFGGGTPSIIKPEYAEDILSEIRQIFCIAGDAEISLEANPGTLDADRLKVYKRAGINRLSTGLQSADDEELKKLGRIHTFLQFKESFLAAREAGFENINVDLMAALPYQTKESFKGSLKKTIDMEPEHISVYSLIIEEGTPFYERYHALDEARAAGNDDTYPLPTEEEERDMYDAAGEILKGAGYVRYEISNYAKPGYECRHNVGCWTGKEYLGFGVSAASYINGERFVNTDDTEGYISALHGEKGAAKSPAEPEYVGTICGKTEPADAGDENDCGILAKIRHTEEIVTKERAMEEFMFLGLRMMRGVSCSDFKERFGRDIDEVYGRVLRKMKKDALMTDLPEGRWRLTEKGVDISNYVLAEFLL